MRETRIENFVAMLPEAVQGDHFLFVLWGTEESVVEKKYDRCYKLDF